MSTVPADSDTAMTLDAETPYKSRSELRAGVARMLGRYGISNDLSESYNRLAAWRITQSGHFTKTEQRAWADRQGTLI